MGIICILMLGIGLAGPVYGQKKSKEERKKEKEAEELAQSARTAVVSTGLAGVGVGLGVAVAVGGGLSQCRQHCGEHQWFPLFPPFSPITRSYLLNNLLPLLLLSSS